MSYPGSDNENRLRGSVLSKKQASMGTARNSTLRSFYILIYLTTKTEQFTQLILLTPIDLLEFNFLSL